MGTETYLQGLISCTLYNFSLDINNNTIWRVQRNTAVNLQVSVLLSLTSGTLTTSYDTSCAISTNYWTITQCMMRTMREGEERRELEEERKEGEGREDGDNWNKNTGGLSENTCRVIDINPERLETVVKLENLQPCTQYSFTLYTRHVVGEQGKVIMEMTQCQGYSKEEQLTHEGSLIRDSAQPSLPFYVVILSIILIIIIISIFITTRHSAFWSCFTLRSSGKWEVENLL